MTSTNSLAPAVQYIGMDMYAISSHIYGTSHHYSAVTDIRTREGPAATACSHLPVVRLQPFRPLWLQSTPR